MLSLMLHTISWDITILVYLGGLCLLHKFKLMRDSTFILYALGSLGVLIILSVAVVIMCILIKINA